MCAQDKQFVKYNGPVGKSWSNDPYTQGSYSCIGVGQEQSFLAVEEYAGEKVKSLFAPIDDTLFFAGEHTTTVSAEDAGFDITGTIEAATEAGERMSRIIAHQYPVK